MKAAIEANYIIPACKEVEPYIKNVIDVTGKAGRKPALVLTGGCAQIEDFTVALKDKFGLDCIVIGDFEYATVLGAVPLSEAVRSKLSEHMQTQPSERLQTAESEFGPGLPEHHQWAVTAINETFDRFSKEIDDIIADAETFDRFGKQIGDIIADAVMSHLIELAARLQSEFYELDIGGDLDNYSWSWDSGNRHIGRSHDSIKQTITSHFAKNLPTSIFRELDGKFTDFFRRLDREALSEVILPPNTYENAVKQVVRSILSEILTAIDIKKMIKRYVYTRQGTYWSTGGPIIQGAFIALGGRLTNREEHVDSIRKRIRRQIGKELEKHLELTKNTQRSHIRDTIVEVLRTTVLSILNSRVGL